jgi:hypothetical protein
MGLLALFGAGGRLGGEDHAVLILLLPLAEDLIAGQCLIRAAIILSSIWVLSSGTRIVSMWLSIVNQYLDFFIHNHNVEVTGLPL